MTAGLGIYDTMQYISAPVATWCIGQASSMGSLLLCAGEKGMRASLPNSRIMVHQPSMRQISVNPFNDFETTNEFSKLSVKMFIMPIISKI